MNACDGCSSWHRTGMALAEKQSQLIEEYQLLPDPQERFSYVLDLSDGAAPLPEDARCPENQVDGCVSTVWLVGEEDNGAMVYRSDSDAPMVKAIAWLLSDFYSGASPAEVVATDPVFLKELRLLDALTENRRRGTLHIVARIKALAKACAA